MDVRRTDADNLKGNPIAMRDHCSGTTGQGLSCGGPVIVTAITHAGGAGRHRTRTENMW